MDNKNEIGSAKVTGVATTEAYLQAFQRPGVILHERSTAIDWTTRPKKMGTAANLTALLRLVQQLGAVL